LGIYGDLEDKGCQKMNQMIPEDEGKGCQMISQKIPDDNRE